MWFKQVEVKNFQAIESAKVELGRGLNILFGPNDLGKSTLASAMRAALLVQPSSTEADGYLPWLADAVPEVSLTFVDDEGHIWRVRKRFGAGSAQKTADLEHSKDGLAFAHDCSGRAVDEQLRKLLGWGIPSPGGKGAPKGLPTSFLAHVLLAKQTEVESLFDRSTEEDGVASGRERLRKALAALAEDPWFKKVLTETQKKVDEYFTPKGHLKRERKSPFVIADTAIKTSAAKIDVLRKRVAESRASEESIRRLQEECSAARDAHHRLAAELATVRRQHARTGERALAEEALARAKTVLDGFERKAKDIVEREERVKALEAEVTVAETEVADASAEVARCEAELRRAKEVFDTAKSGDGERQRELARAKLDAERAEVILRIGKCEKRREGLERAQRAMMAVEAADATKKAARLEAERAGAAEGAAKRGLVEAEKALDGARALLAYGQWHAADAAMKQAMEVKSEAEALGASAIKKENDAAERDAHASTSETTATSRQERLPDAALTRRLEELEQQRAVAQAALGGGFSLALKGSGAVPVHITIDGTEAMAGTALQGRLKLDGERTAFLRVGELLEVEIHAGAADKLHALEVLDEQWANEAEPVFERAGLKTTAAIRDESAGVRELLTAASNLRSEARQLRTEAEAARQAARMKEQQSRELVAHGREAEPLKAKLRALDPEALARSFAALGNTWREKAARDVAANERALALAREAWEQAERARDRAVFRVDEADKSAASAQTELESTCAEAGVGEPGDNADTADAIEQALARVREQLSEHSAQRAAITDKRRDLEGEEPPALVSARTSMVEAQTKHAQSLAQRTHADEARKRADAELAMARGGVETLRKELESADRAGAEARFLHERAALDAYADDPRVSADDVAAAERHEADAKAEYDQLRAELHQAEGALTKVGGPGDRDELVREEEAHALAKERLDELEIDAKAWMLLRQALDEAEKEQGTHLGRSLAVPVSERLAELTAGRYRALHLDPHLRAEKVDVPLVATDDNVLDALSVGTRGQIATLLRLTVAEYLKSAVVLDDHLVHTDADRLGWFRDMLRKTAVATQVIVLTCRPHDYIAASELPEGDERRDLAGGAIRIVDMARALRRWTTPRMDAPSTSASPPISTSASPPTSERQEAPPRIEHELTNG
ncbi:AAA family ATPase [Pendulispora albinea]|uniref:AAA family ATPase n=1 Tax=Pendulispora albinea TaxID=2741071 RepID=A0ABZ2M5S8_9BACT